jgi:hypothetical protein
MALANDRRLQLPRKGAERLGDAQALFSAERPDREGEREGQV